jgi:hypothetical protein
MTGSTEERLRDTLDLLATRIDAVPPAYGPAKASWRRRERRRRLILAVLIAVVFTVVDIIGLWALNQAQDGTHVIFDDRGRTEQHEPTPPGGIGPP